MSVMGFDPMAGPDQNYSAGEVGQYLELGRRSGLGCETQAERGDRRVDRRGPIRLQRGAREAQPGTEDRWTAEIS
jgi:hypothetical protein